MDVSWTCFTTPRGTVENLIRKLCDEVLRGGLTRISCLCPTIEHVYTVTLPIFIVLLVLHVRGSCHQEAAASRAARFNDSTDHILRDTILAASIHSPAVVAASAFSLA